MITRFALLPENDSGMAEIVEHPFGGFVEYSDYLLLLQENRRLKYGETCIYYAEKSNLTPESVATNAFAVTTISPPQDITDIVPFLGFMVPYVDVLKITRKE